MKRRNFIAGIAAITGAIGIGKSVVAEETFLEKLKRLGCTIKWHALTGIRDGNEVHLVSISHKNGFLIWKISGTRAGAYQSLEESFDDQWKKHQRSLDQFAING